MTTDLVSDMITRIRNANLAKHTFTRVQYSQFTLTILTVLISENYLKPYYEIEYNEAEKPVTIKVFLQYKGWWIKKPFFSSVIRISKPGRRVFSSYKSFTKLIDILRYNQGIAVVSTSSGVMSHRKAEKVKKGGEVLFYIG